MTPFLEIGELVEQNVVSLQTGPFGSQLHSYDYIESGVPVVPTEGIQGGRLDHSVLPKISEEKASELSRHRLLVGDVLFARRGAQATGKTARVRENEAGFICGTGAIRARIHSETVLNRDFFAWFLSAPDTVAWIREQAIGATMPNLNPGIIKRIEVPLFPLPEQREIAAILGALDDKIELNRKTAATLEEMARALYRSWFVDFDPVHAKAAGRAPAHMDTQTAALFPGSFGEDGLPEGWELTTIGEVGSIAGGATPKTKEPAFWDGGHHLWATPRDLSSLKQPVLFDTDRKITDAGLRKISSGLSPEGTLLLSSRAPIGYLAIAKMPVAVNQGFIAIRETNKISGLEAYFWCAENMDLIHANANGSTFQEISKKNFRSLQYVLAPPEVRNAFNKQGGALFDRISMLCQENQTLSTLRDTLLPRLMSGELRVGAAIEQVKEAVQA